MVRIDKVQLDIAINGDPARLKLHQLEQDAIAVKREMKGIKDETEKANKQAKLDNIHKKMEDLKHQIGLVNMTTGELGKRLTDLKRIQSKLDPNSKLWKEYDDEIKAIVARQKELHGVTEKTSSTFDFLKTSTLAVIGVVTGLVASIGGLIGSVIEVYGEFEKYRSVLTNTFGSQEKANEAMEMLQDTASKLPVSLREVTEGYIKMVNRGFIPTQNEIIKLSDLASSQGKSLDQFIEAMMDAQTGEFERLKEFGVKAKSVGDNVTFTFRGQTETVQKSEKAIQAYLLKLGELPGIAGSSAAVMNTLQGQISNLGDGWDRMLVAMGDGGFGKLAKNVISLTSGIVNAFTDLIAASPSEMLEDSRIKLQAEQIQLNSSNLKHEDRVTLINKLKEEYPAYLGNIDAETASNEELNIILNKINEDLVNKIVLQKADEEIQKKQNDIAQAKLNLGENEITLNKQIAETAKEQGLTVRKELGDTYKVAEDLQRQLKEKRGLDPKGLLGGDTDLSAAMQNFSVASGMYNKLMAEGNGLAEHRNELMKTLNLGLYDQNEAMKKANDEAAATKKKAEEEAAAAEAKRKEALKKQSDEQNKLREDQAKYRKELINQGVSEQEKEYGRYRDELVKLGLLDKNYHTLKRKLTAEEQEAQRVALQIHFKNLSEIEEKAKAEELKAKQEKLKQAENILTENHQRELDKLEIAENEKLRIEGKTAADRERIHNDFNEKREAKELAFLLSLKKLYEDAGLDTVNIDKRISKERLKQYEDGNKELEEILREKKDLEDKYGGKDDIDKINEEEKLEEERLKRIHDSGIWSEQEYLDMLDNLHDEYNAKRLEKDAENIQKSMDMYRSLSESVSGLKELELQKAQTAYQKETKELEKKHKTDLANLNQKFKSGQLSEEQYNKAKQKLDQEYSESKTTLEEQQAEKEKAIRKRFANAEFALKVGEIIANTAVAIMKAYAELGPIGGSIAAALLGTTGAIQIGIANEQRAQVMQLAKGKYNVIGAEDKRSYNNVPLVKNLETGLITSPTLVAEEPEAVISIKDTDFAMKYYPQLFNDLRLIHNGMVPQREEGKYDSVPGYSQSSDANLVPLLSALNQNITVNNAYLNALLQNGTLSIINWTNDDTENLLKAQQIIAEIKARASAVNPAA